jgi:hypothetical protein
VGSSPVIAAEWKLTTKAAPGSRTPKAPPIYAQASFNNDKYFSFVILSLIGGLWPEFDKAVARR